MAGEQETSQDECFIVGVIGKAGSAERIHADWFIDGIVIPVFAAHFLDFKVTRADRMNKPGIITSQIIEKLLTAKLVIADMTFLNANAFYEIGIRHMTGLPIIHTHQDGDPIPFDVSTFLSLPYSRVEYQHIMSAQTGLKALVDNVLSPGFEVENPVTQARGRAKFDATASAPDRILQMQIDELGDRIVRMERSGLKDNNRLAIAEALMSRPKPPAPPSTLTFSVKEGVPGTALNEFLENALRVYLGENVRVVRQSEFELEINYPSGPEYADWERMITNEAASRGIWAVPF